MPINFDTLPGNKPISLPDKGTYYAVIDRADMKAPKDPNKPPYLNMQFSLTTFDGKAAGKIYDLLTESNHEFIRYKIQRFITALEIPITGSFELKDLCKIIVGKKFIVDITHQEDENYPTKAVVDIFQGDIYYPMSQASLIFDTPTGDDVPFVINASDAADADSPAADQY